MKKPSVSYLLECYAWLTELLYSQKSLTKEQIDEYWAKASVNEEHTPNIPESTFYRWRNAVQTLFHISIECDSEGHYSIESLESVKGNSSQYWLLNSLVINKILSENKELNKQVIFEPISSDLKFLATIIEAMRDKLQVHFTYQNFKQTTPIEFTAKPYFVKQFRQRWYMIALSDGYDEFRHYSLDRMQSIEITDIPYTMPENFSADEYFKDVYGVTISKSDKKELIKVLVNYKQVPYLRSLPLHHSQKEIETKPYGDAIFSFELIPNAEFISELHSYGMDLIVLEPKWLQNEFYADYELLYKHLYPEEI